MTESTALELVGIRAGYDETVVVQDVSVVVPEGSVTALVGPNGAGKTTLLKVASGLLRPRQGTVCLFGEDVTGWSPERRSAEGLCMIPEGRGIYRSLTVRENLIVQSPKGRERESIERATSAFKILGERLKQQAGTLSGGEQQMLSLAAAYVRNPRLILVDEASLGLAPIIVDFVFDTLSELAESGVTMLLVDQFANRVLAVASTAYVLRHGEVVFNGRASDLLEGDVFRHYLGEDTL